MNIALVNNYYYLRGGSERVLFGDQAALRALGHEVLPFSIRDEQNEESAAGDLFPTVPDTQRAGLVNQVCSAAGHVYAPAIGRAFGAFLDRFQPDIVHCHNIYGRLTTAVLDQARQRGVPAVLTAHDQKLVCPAYLALRRGRPCQLCADGGYWRCLRWKCHKNGLAGSLVYTVESYTNRGLGKYNTVSRFLCPSNFQRESLIRAGIDVRRAVYHPNALPAAEYDPEFAAGDYILYAGRLSEEKGLRTLLRAAPRLPLPLRIAGTGPLDEELRGEIARRRLFEW
jgi:glycosyltransferase involved in cell wall biosynthesis